MRHVLWPLGVLALIGCAQPVPPVEAVALPSQTRTQAEEEPVGDVLIAALGVFHLERGTTVIFRRSLPESAQQALRSSFARLTLRPAAPDTSAVPADTVVVEDVTIVGPSATVHLTFGPVTPELTWVCGRSMSIPLTHTVQWQVVETGRRVRCASGGPQGLPRDQQELLEAARLVFSQIHLGPSIRVVRGTALSADAVAALGAIGELRPRAQFETEEMRVLADVFVLNRLERTAGGIEFEGTLGPVPRRATLACGSNWTMLLRPHEDGWSFEKTALTVC